MSDTECIGALVKQAQEGSLDAFDKLFIEIEAKVFQIAYRMTGNMEDAKDASQEILLKIYRLIEQFEGKSQFYTWLYRLSVNTCIDYMRKKGKNKWVSLDADEEGSKKQMDIPDQDAVPLEQVLKKESAKKLQEALNMLSDAHKAVVILKDVQGYPYADIAHMLEISEGTVKSRLARARVQLRSILTEREQNKTQHRLTDRKEGDE